MLVRYVLLTFPIHRRSFSEYYRLHDVEVQARREDLEREWSGQPFDALPAHIRLAWKDRHRWPPWYFNDRVGYLKIGSDGESSMLADVYLERRYFPPTAPERFTRRGGAADDEREIVFLASVERRSITLGDNASYIAACLRILDDARDSLRQQVEGLPDVEVWQPGFDLDCYDLARADLQLRERFPNRTDPR
jgi:hypothetical protein